MKNIIGYAWLDYEVTHPYSGETMLVSADYEIVQREMPTVDCPGEPEYGRVTEVKGVGFEIDDEIYDFIFEECQEEVDRLYNVVNV